MSDRPTTTLTTIVERAIDRPLSALDGDVDLAEAGASPAPADRLRSRIANAESVVGVVPAVDPDLVDAVLDVEDRDGDSDGNDDGDDPRAVVVLTGDARAALDGPTGPAVRAALADRDATAFRHDGDSPVGILLADDVACVGLFDGGLAALLTSDADPIRRWAAETCRRYRADAEPIGE